MYAKKLALLKGAHPTEPSVMERPGYPVKPHLGVRIARQVNLSGNQCSSIEFKIHFVNSNVILVYIFQYVVICNLIMKHFMFFFFEPRF